MLIGYMLTGKRNLETILVFCIHWLSSFWYHQTYKNIHKHVDQLWIQFLSCELLGLCDPNRGLLLRIMSFPGFLNSVSIANKTLLVSGLCAIGKFNHLRTCGSGIGFFFWIIVSSFLYLVNHPILFSSLGIPINKDSRSPILCILFHLAIGFTAYYEYSGQYCKEIEPLYPRVFDLIYYLSCTLFFF